MNKCRWFGHDWERVGHVTQITDSSGRIYGKAIMPMIKTCKRCDKLAGDIGGSVTVTYDYREIDKLLLDFMADYNSSKQIRTELKGEPGESMSRFHKFTEVDRQNYAFNKIKEQLSKMPVGCHIAISYDGKIVDSSETRLELLKKLSKSGVESMSVFIHKNKTVIV